MLNISSRGFDHVQYCIGWYMVEYVNQIYKQIANTLPKIINDYKDKHLDLFPQVNTGFISKLRILPDI